MAERFTRYFRYLQKHRTARRTALQNGTGNLPSEPTVPSGSEQAEKRYTLEEAFDYFMTPPDENPDTSQINNERCIRAVAFLLHYCSNHGNDDVYGWTAHGLGYVLEQCASDVRRPDEHRKWLREHGAPSE